MNDRKDLAALARALRHRGGQLLALLPKRNQADGRLMLQAAKALSESAAEADGPQSTAALALNLSQELHEHGNHAWAREVEAIWRTMSAQEHALAAAAPLFEACHISASQEGDWDPEYELTPLEQTASDWARSEAGQAGLAAHRAERSGG